MMDLLIFLCAQYHLNPSSYTIELISAENSQIKFKPNTPVGMLEVEKVILKPKQVDKKKPAPVIPEVRTKIIAYWETRITIVYCIQQLKLIDQPLVSHFPVISHPLTMHPCENLVDVLLMTS